ncbi:Zn(2)-C6 fungal-type DNA-binding domain [Phaffia rhodozyma]|uniref:Zn(2)-C6 fungal-type DNA-binding domain n=1 Tax=Phaffia rhodozyma TaxID=264483 RepID=A0A0F7SR97_PHARH|nr:Zn(2)-C6 fungal-type DNA-binding domain [Phaffia rhodozyma]
MSSRSPQPPPRLVSGTDIDNLRPAVPLPPPPALFGLTDYGSHQLSPEDLEERREAQSKLKRTRDGCFTCRTRKKKCDLIRPICGSCARLDFKCQFPQQIQDAQGRLITVKQPNKRKKGVSEDNPIEPDSTSVEATHGTDKTPYTSSATTEIGGKLKKAKKAQGSASGKDRPNGINLPHSYSPAQPHPHPQASSDPSSWTDPQTGRPSSLRSSSSSSTEELYVPVHQDHQPPPSTVETRHHHLNAGPPDPSAIQSTPAPSNQYKDLMELLLAERAITGPDDEAKAIARRNGVSAGKDHQQHTNLPNMLSNLSPNTHGSSDHLNFPNSQTRPNPHQPLPHLQALLPPDANSSDLQNQMLSHFQKQFSLHTASQHNNPSSAYPSNPIIAAASPGFVEWMSGFTGPNSNGELSDILRGFGISPGEGIAGGEVAPSPSLSWILPARRESLSNGHGHTNGSSNSSGNGNGNFDFMSSVVNHSSVPIPPIVPPSSTSSYTNPLHHPHNNHLTPTLLFPNLSPILAPPLSLHQPYNPQPQTSNARQQSFSRPIAGQKPNGQLSLRRESSLVHGSSPVRSFARLHDPSSTIGHQGKHANHQPAVLPPSWETSTSDPEDFFYIPSEGGFLEVGLEDVVDDDDRAIGGFVNMNNDGLRNEKDRRSELDDQSASDDEIEEDDRTEGDNHREEEQERSGGARPRKKRRFNALPDSRRGSASGGGGAGGRGRNQSISLRRDSTGSTILSVGSSLAFRLPDLPPLVVQQAPLLIDYFIRKLAPLVSVLAPNSATLNLNISGEQLMTGSGSNPWDVPDPPGGIDVCTVFLPMAFSSELLLLSVLCWSAMHLSDLGEPWREIAEVMRAELFGRVQGSFKAWEESISVPPSGVGADPGSSQGLSVDPAKGSKVGSNNTKEDVTGESEIERENETGKQSSPVITPEEILAGLVVFSEIEICRGSTEKWFHPLLQARKVVQRMTAEKRQKSWVAKWLMQNWAYHELLSSTTSLDGPSLEPEEYGVILSGGMNTFMGPSMMVFQLIAEISRLSVQAAQCIHFEDRAARIESLRVLAAREARLKTRLDAVYPEFPSTADPSSPAISYHLIAFRAHVLTARLYLRQVVSHCNAFSLVTQLLVNQLLATIAQLVGTPAESSLLFPLFVTGVDATTDADRREIKARFDMIDTNCRIGNIQTAFSLLEEIWDRNEGGEKWVDWPKLSRECGWNVSFA